MEKVKLIYDDEFGEIQVGDKSIKLWNDESASEHLYKMSVIFKWLNIEYEESK
jgi:hypothetical protein